MEIGVTPCFTGMAIGASTRSKASPRPEKVRAKVRA